MAKSSRARCKKVNKRELNARVKPLIDRRVAQLSATITGEEVDMTPVQFKFAPHKKNIKKARAEEGSAMETESTPVNKLGSGSATGKSKSSRSVVGKIVKTSVKATKDMKKKIKVHITDTKKKIIA